MTETRHSGKTAGENHARAKLTAAQVAEIRRRYEAGGITMAQLGTEYDVHAMTVQKIVRGKRWQVVETALPTRAPSRRWTERELAVLADTLHQTAATVAKRLRRSVASVEVQRTRLRSNA